MKTAILILVAATLGTACAGPGSLHSGRTTLADKERAAMVAGPPKKGSPFRRVWRSRASWGYLKWDEDRSSTVAGAPAGLLQAMRDEVGRVNQRARAGGDAHLAVTVYRYRPEGFLSRSRVEYEAAARDEKGALLWAVEDVIEPSPDKAESLADDEASLIARELARKVRAEFGR